MSFWTITIHISSTISLTWKDQIYNSLRKNISFEASFNFDFNSSILKFELTFTHWFLSWLCFNIFLISGPDLSVNTEKYLENKGSWKVQHSCWKKYQILQITWKKWNKEHQTLSFQFFINKCSILMFLFCFFMLIARFQILIR